MNRTTVAMVVLFLLAAAWLLMPFQSHRVVHSPGLDRNRPAGQVTADFALVEMVPASFMAGLDPGLEVDCIALRFATYMRRNRGRIDITFGQRDLGHRWRLDASRLADNSYVNLCLDQTIDLGEAFWIGIAGVDGEPDRSATVWLSASRDREVAVNGRTMPGWGLALRLTRSRQVELPHLLNLNHGVFIAGFLVSVAVGLIVLLQCPLRSVASPRIQNDRVPPEHA